MSSCAPASARISCRSSSMPAPVFADRKTWRSAAPARRRLPAPRGSPPSARARRDRSCCGRRAAAAPPGSCARIAASASAMPPPAAASTSTSARSARATAAHVRSMPSVSIGSSVGRKPGGVDDRQRNAADLDLRLHGVARRPGDRRDDRHRVARQLVEQARLADVGPADEHDGEALAQQRALLRPRQHPGHLRARSPRPCRARRRRAGTRRPRRESRASPRCTSAARSARRPARGSRARTRRTRLRAAARAAVAVAASMRSATLSACARSSLPLRNARCVNSPGSREPRAELDAAREQQPQHHRAAVPVQLEHVLAGVRARRRESGARCPGRAPRRARRGTRRASRPRGASCRRTIPAMIARTPAPDTRTTPTPPRPRRRDRRDRVGRGSAAALPAAPRIRLPCVCAAGPAPPASGAWPRRAPLPSRARGSCATAGRSAASC